MVHGGDGSTGEELLQRFSAWKPLEMTEIPDYERALSESSLAVTKRFYTPGAGGLAKWLLSAKAEVAAASEMTATKHTVTTGNTMTTPWSVLFVFAVEGDNLAESVLLWRESVRALLPQPHHHQDQDQDQQQHPHHQEQQRLAMPKLPPSWEHMYGGRFDVELY